MTLDEIIASVEAEIVDQTVNGVKAALAAWIPGFVAWVLTPIGSAIFDWFIAPAVRYVAKIVVKFFDNKGYFLYKSAQNNAAANKYVDRARDLNSANESRDKDAISKARAAKREAFLAFWPLTA